MRQVLQRLVVFGGDKPVFCILPYGLDCAEPWRRGRQVQDLQSVVLLQMLQHIPVLVLACVVRYEENLASLAAHLLEVSYKRRAVKLSILPHQPGPVLGKRAEHDGPVPPAIPAGSLWIPDARPQLPSVRPRSEKYGLVLHHDRKSAPFCPRYRACGTGLLLPHRVGASCRGIHGSRPLGREPEEAQDPAHAAQAVPGIESPAYLVSQLSRGEHVLAGKPVG